MGVDQNKMKAPSAPLVLLGLMIIVLLSSVPASRAQRAFLSKYIWRSKLQRPFLQMFREEQMGRPQEMSQERFQRGVDPADEGQEVDMRMIFDALKRDIRAAMDGEDVASNIEKKEEEPEKKEEEPSTSPHLKEFSPYFSLYKYRL